ncbi:peptidoglycan DD-metalloendopeptidase family protein [Wigglesworthia glossinidia]|uniref:peptidoglycan DD-metalloendopeptidase family protein n=1 Tax=Wigglesworthia glossinidia TaxID=51229 RepID=UPI0002FDCB12|nr:peptidoglycan DD-metalloendopeptidase family protein [Wigglesworthia glossinidia]
MNEFIVQKKLKTQKKTRKNIRKKNDIIYKSKFWIWPSKGKITIHSSRKKLEIFGKYNQPILAAHEGQVVYVGNNIKGYGNLIILKHKNNYLSIYAHNNTILVSKKQKIKSGQKIATMGKSNSNETKLYFEIRYRGKSIDPMSILTKK